MNNEEKARQYFKRVNKGGFTCDTMIAFKDGADWKQEQMIQKAVEWLYLNLEKYGCFNCLGGNGKVEPKIIEDFKKVMEE